MEYHNTATSRVTTGANLSEACSRSDPRRESHTFPPPHPFDRGSFRCCISKTRYRRLGMKEQPAEHRSARPWNSQRPPSRILAMRFHAIGDVAVTCSALSSLRTSYPNAIIDLLTSEVPAELAESIHLFDTVIRLQLPGSRPARLAMALRAGLRSINRGYDVVLDLQRNWISRVVRNVIRPTAWAEFDRFSRSSALQRTRKTISEAGLEAGETTYALSFRGNALEHGRAILARHGWRDHEPLVCLNPAGIWSSRQWPTENYVRLAKEWPLTPTVRFVMLGKERMAARSSEISEALGDRIIDLVGKTSLAGAFSIVQMLDAMVSEDSGLMHMAWVSGIPTIALFGSSRNDWSAPEGPHTTCFHSGDLACGACMDPVCRFGDTHCLTRWTPQQVLQEALRLMEKSTSRRQA